MAKLSKAEYQALLRRNFFAFACRAFWHLHPGTKFDMNWHHEVACTGLQDCLYGDILRLILLMPPRSCKSFLASVAFPAFALGHFPHMKLMCVSYGQDLAEKHARDCLSIMQSDWYKELFPNTQLTSQRPALQELMTTRHGYRLATSIGGVVTGRGADFIIIDDPIKPEEAFSRALLKKVIEYYASTLLSRLDGKIGGRIILVMHRLHEEDLAGYLQAKKNWAVLRFPAIADKEESFLIRSPLGNRQVHRKMGQLLHPEREPLEILEDLRRNLGEYNFAGQYQQAPAPLDGGLIKAAWFKPYDQNQLPESFDQVIQSWDTASKPGELNDFSVCITLGLKGAHIYVLNVLRKHLSYPDLKRAVRDQWLAFKPSVILIEDKNSGTQLIQELIGEGVHAVKKYEPKGDKIMRMNAQTATIENGFVHLPREAAWLAEYLHELASFPRGRYDDQVDATAQALEWIKLSRNSDADALLEHFGRMAAEANGFQQKKDDQRLKAPANYTPQFYAGNRLFSLDPDGTCMIPAELVDAMLRNGWQNV